MIERINTDVCILKGDVLDMLRKLHRESIHCIVTSPPYWGLRDYGVEGQIGLEASPQEYLKKMVRVFRAARRVLRNDGTLWVNMGDCYAGQRGGFNTERSTLQGKQPGKAEGVSRAPKRGHRLKPKDLVGMPWRLALALQADGWWLRRDIIWAKRNPMPETVRDRCTTAHEYFFHLSKSERYHYDAKAIMEPCSVNTHSRGNGINAKVRKAFPSGWGKGDEPRNLIDLNVITHRVKANRSFAEGTSGSVDKRNKRSVWEIQIEPFSEAHFATFAPSWIEPAILAGCPAGGTVLDLFGGSGTTAGVALAHGRKAVLIELNPSYCNLMPRRIEQVMRDMLNAPAPQPQPINQASLFI